MNKTVQYTDSVDIEGKEIPLIYEILWQKEICTMTVEMGEIVIEFEVPKRKTFAGLRLLSGVKASKSAVFESIGIALTRKCTAQCEMCCFECGPDKTEELEEELVLRIIEEASEIDEIKRVGFTGGEAVLRGEFLIKAIVKVKEKGMKTSLTSNGFWGKTPEQAQKWLQQFKMAGLDSLTISIDEYHQNYVPIQSIRNIIRANRDVHLNISFAVGDSLGERDALSILKELGTDAYEIQLMMYPFMPVGRRENLEHVILKDIEDSWKCHNQKLLSILYDGSVYPCCSQGVYGSHMCEGNIRDMSLREIIDRYKYLSMYSVLTHHNFGWLVEKAEEYGIEVSKKSYSPCALCHELFSNEEFVKQFRKDAAVEKFMAVLTAKV